MAEDINQIKEFVKNLSTPQKIAFSVIILLVVASLAGIIFWANTPEYGILYSNLSPDDAGEVIQKLKDMKIPYKVSGSIIKIPEDKVAEVRMELASQGLPKGGGVGFEIFDKSKFGMTETLERINYTRALEGELSRTISSLREVKSARVHIVLPKKSVFLEESEPAKASVILNLLPGATLSRTSVRSIVHLLASSVEGLNPENITVVDVYGRLLSKPQGDTEEDAITLKQIEAEKKLEEELSQKIVRLLEPVVGIGKVKADVDVELDFTKKEQIEELYDPDSQIERSKQTIKEELTQYESGGAPGVSSNVAMAANVAPTNVPIKVKKSTKETKNYELSKTVRKISYPTGVVKRLSVAVVVDDAVKTEEKDGKLVKKKVKREQAELEKIKNIVSAAVGVNKNRGDIIEVTNLSFDETSLKESDQFLNEYEKRQLIKTLIRYGVILIIALLIIFVVVKPLISKLIKVAQPEAPAPSFDGITPEGELTKGAEALERGEPVPILEEAAREEVERELAEQFKIPKETHKIEILKEKLIDFAKENPDDLAAVIKALLIE